MRRSIAVVAVAAVGVLGFTACGDDDSGSQSEAEAALCTDIPAFKAAVAGLEGVRFDQEANADNPSVQALQTAWDDMVDSARELNEADAEAVTTSLDGLQQAAEDISPDATPGQARTAMAPHVIQVQQAFASMEDGLPCT